MFGTLILLICLYVCFVPKPYCFYYYGYVYIYGYIIRSGNVILKGLYVMLRPF